MNWLRVQVLGIFSLAIGANLSATYAQEITIKQVKLAKFNENVFASFLSEGELFLCSDKSTKAMRNVSNENGSKFLNLYSVAVENEKPQGKLKELQEGINTRLNQGPIFLDEKNHKAYYSSNTSDSIEGDFKLELYTADYNNGIFTNTAPLKILGTEFNSSHPIIIENGNKMIFASDLNGVSNQSDLFISMWNGEVWSTPKVIPNINSSKTETFPTFYKNTLYFSSDRSDGFGGLDLYKSEYIEGEFQEPEILLAPLNSEFDDFLFIEKDESSGYLSSNRKGGVDRIFYYEYQIPKPLKFEDQLASFCYRFEDEDDESNEALEYIWYFGDGNSEKGNVVKYCYQELGEYHVYCDILDTRTNETINEVADFDVLIQAETPIIQWAKDRTGEKITVYVEHKYAKDKYENWYWILNDEILFDKTFTVDLTKTESIDIKLVCYDTKESLPVIGLHKKLR